MLSFELDIRKGDFHLNAGAELPAQGVIGLIGGSGAGKTTLLRALAGLEPSASGHVCFNRQTWFDSRKRIDMPLHRRSIGFVFQQPSLLPHLTVQGNLDYAWRRVPGDRRQLSQSEAVAYLDIARLLNRHPDQLSGGESQRVAIARSLCANPGLLLMDEPLASVDVSGRKEILQLLEELRDKLTLPIIYVSHALDEVARLSDIALFMQKGRLLAQGSTHEMLTRLDLPLAHAADAEALLEVAVDKYDDINKISYLSCDAGRLYVTQKLVPGSQHRLRICARDVSIALSHAQDSSILNILPVSVLEIVEGEQGQSLLRLSAGNKVILARLSQQSVRRLSLKAGMEVFAQIKAVSLV